MGLNFLLVIFGCVTPLTHCISVVTFIGIKFQHNFMNIIIMQIQMWPYLECVNFVMKSSSLLLMLLEIFRFCHLIYKYIITHRQRVHTIFTIQGLLIFTFAGFVRIWAHHGWRTYKSNHWSIQKMYDRCRDITEIQEGGNCCFFMFWVSLTCFSLHWEIVNFYDCAFLVLDSFKNVKLILRFWYLLIKADVRVE